MFFPGKKTRWQSTPSRPPPIREKALSRFIVLNSMPSCDRQMIDWICDSTEVYLMGRDLRGIYKLTFPFCGNPQILSGTDSIEICDTRGSVLS
jgi:hypothetical protein